MDIATQDMMKCKCLNTTHLKIIALVSMIIDHTGEILFPDIIVLRIIGRLAFPIYAFLIGEGLLHSHNKNKYFLKTLVTFFVFQLVSYFIHREIRIYVLYGFLSAIAITIIHDWAQKNIHQRKYVMSILILVIITLSLISDYIIFATLLPLTIYYIKNPKIKLLVFIVFLILCSLFYKSIQWFSLLAIIPIILYNGKKGKELLFKNSFYVLYPLHYLILGIIYYFI